MERVGTDNDIDERYLSYYVEGEIIPNERRQLGVVLPLINSISNVVHECVPECNPTSNIVSVEESCLFVAPSNDCTIMVLNMPPNDLWDVDEIVDLGKALPPADLWDADKVFDLDMGYETWTINTALVDGGFWDVPFVTNPGTPFEEAAAQDSAFLGSIGNGRCALGLSSGARFVNNGCVSRQRKAQAGGCSCRPMGFC